MKVHTIDFTLEERESRLLNGSTKKGAAYYYWYKEIGAVCNDEIHYACFSPAAEQEFRVESQHFLASFQPLPPPQQQQIPISMEIGNELPNKEIDDDGRTTYF